jgi:hypothetical protein
VAQEIEGIPPLGLPGASAFASFQAALAAQQLLASQRLAAQAIGAEAPSIAEPGVTEFVPAPPVTTGAPTELREEPQPTVAPPSVPCPPPAAPRPAPCITLTRATICFTNPCLDSSQTLREFGRPLGELESGNPALVGPPLEICVQDQPRVILLLGYWPPTDVGIDKRHGMLWKWKDLQKDYKGSGYDVLAISPEFPEKPIGVAPRGTVIPFWGRGTGQLTVDYRDTSEDFWAIIDKYKPIAIMSFSRAKDNNRWEYEGAARNLPQREWATSIEFTDSTGKDDIERWQPPYAGGSADDFSPFKGTGAIPGNPPDPTKPAGKGRATMRDNNLPEAQFKAEIEKVFPRGAGNLVWDPDPSGDVAAFVSEYMAYHVAWYRDYSQDRYKTEPTKQCLRAGHTHVGIRVAVADAEKAVEIQLDELIKVLPKVVKK